jgi:biopolymer transport protein ExbB/TolQ
MKKNILFVIVGLSMLSFTVAKAEEVRIELGDRHEHREVRDVRDLEAAHNHIVDTIQELERARKANHYDMKGHGEKAERALREAEHELHDAIESAKSERR